MRSEGRSSPSRKNTPGPRYESTCPTMTDDPIAPGRGLPVYQPASEVVGGTCSMPLFVTPRSTSLVRTPMAGMIRLTGRGTSPAGEVGPGSALTGPAGTDTAGTWCRPNEALPDPSVMIRPARPAPAASTPNPTIASVGPSATPGLRVPCLPAPGLPGPGLPGPGLPAPRLPGPGLPAARLPGPGLPGPRLALTPVGASGSRDHAAAARRARPAQPPPRSGKPGRSARAGTSADTRDSAAGPADLPESDDPGQRQPQPGRGQHQPRNG